MVTHKPPSDSGVALTVTVFILKREQRKLREAKELALYILNLVLVRYFNLHLDAQFLGRHSGEQAGWGGEL